MDNAFLNTPNFAEFQKAGQRQVEAYTALTAAFGKGFQDLATESTDYSKKAFAVGAATFEKLIAAKSVDAASQIQAEYAKTAYEGFVAQSHKVAELFTKLASEAVKPVESAFTKAA
jgi:hypothetical protein